ncbi:hypothetical protein OV090_45550 [Nannocystis sp. RBIL2]|uniref:hypothetical protein n=1 Tax=Nannocystis sp. RBIL2 TaxID=2996788 RepID=UPI0022706880|nr:hypothetical protein [Nannocystis sp. RBIL2]MCY1072097.1 hypothetical protein [Nannocystis sp. RBIL2]
MLRALLVLPLLSLLACPAAENDTTASDGSSGSDPSPASGADPTAAMFDSSGPTSTTSTTSTASTTSTSETSASATSEDGPEATGEASGTNPDSLGTSATATTAEDTTSTTTADVPVACDPWLEDCPEGQKCAAYDEDGAGLTWTGYQCVPLAPQPAQLGQPCTVTAPVTSGLDTCDEHLMCWDLDDQLAGHCVAMCEGTPESPSCAAPDTYCAQADNDVLILCLPGCDPLVQDCPVGEACYPHHAQQGVFACYPDAGGREGQVFDACEFLNVCDPGLLCLFPAVAVECDQDAAGCCMPYCDLGKPNTCPGAGQECLPLLEEPTPKYGDLGACSVWE